MNSPLAISIIWGIYQIVPYALVLFYWLVSKGVMLQYMCRLGLLVTFVSGAAAVGLMWGLYPPNYNFARVSQPSQAPGCSRHEPSSCVAAYIVCLLGRQCASKL